MRGHCRSRFGSKTVGQSKRSRRTESNVHQMRRAARRKIRGPKHRRWHALTAAHAGEPTDRAVQVSQVEEQSSPTGIPTGLSTLNGVLPSSDWTTTLPPPNLPQPQHVSLLQACLFSSSIFTVSPFQSTPTPLSTYDKYPGSEMNVLPHDLKLSQTPFGLYEQQSQAYYAQYANSLQSHSYIQY